MVHKKYLTFTHFMGAIKSSTWTGDQLNGYQSPLKGPDKGFILYVSQCLIIPCVTCIVKGRYPLWGHKDYTQGKIDVPHYRPLALLPCHCCPHVCWGSRGHTPGACTAGASETQVINSA